MLPLLPTLCLLAPGLLAVPIRVTVTTTGGDTLVDAEKFEEKAPMGEVYSLARRLGAWRAPEAAAAGVLHLDLVSAKGEVVDEATQLQELLEGRNSEGLLLQAVFSRSLHDGATHHREQLLQPSKTRVHDLQYDLLRSSRALGLRKEVLGEQILHLLRLVCVLLCVLAATKLYFGTASKTAVAMIVIGLGGSSPQIMQLGSYFTERRRLHEIKTQLDAANGEVRRLTEQQTRLDTEAHQLEPGRATNAAHARFRLAMWGREEGWEEWEEESEEGWEEEK